MSPESQWIAAILFVSVPTVAFGGASLLAFIRKRVPGYLDNPVRQALFRAGHAHAGVLILFALVALLYVDQLELSSVAKHFARIALAAAPILMPAGFFFSVLSPRAERPGKLIALTYLGALSLASGVVTVAIGLFRSVG